MKPVITQISLFITTLALLTINLPGQTFMNLHNFAPFGTGSLGLRTNADGGFPYGRLVLSGTTLYGTTSSYDTNGLGGLFKINTDGSQFTNFFAFSFNNISNEADGINGSDPIAGLSVVGNQLYGITTSGGSNYNGSVFTINTDGTGLFNLHGFSALVSHALVKTNSDGADPQAGVVVSGGMVYGTTYAGGFHGLGTIYAVGTNGSGFTNLFNFAGTNGQNPEADLILAGGTLYGTTFMGGSDGNTNGTIFSIGTNGANFSLLHSFSPLGYPYPFNYDGAYPVGGLVLSGNLLYGTASEGGMFENGYGTIFEINTNGNDFATILDFQATNGAGPYGDLILSGSTLYGTTSEGIPDSTSANAGTVFEINTSGSGFSELYGFPAPGYSGTAYTNSTGSEPWAGPVLAGNTLFGVVPTGGTGGSGTIYSVSLSPGSTPPQLTIIPSSSNLIVSWPTNAGLTLQFATNLGPSTVWSTSPTVPAVVGGQNVVTNPTTGTQEFFRLSQ